MSDDEIPAKYRPDDDAEYYREKADAGWSQRDMADDLGVSRQTVRKRMERLGAEPASHEPPTIDDVPDDLTDRICRLYVAEYLTIGEVADRIEGDTPDNFDAWTGMVRRVLLANDVEIRSRADYHITGGPAPEDRGRPDYGAEWPDRREAALERDDYECQHCALSDDEHRERYGHGLHVHHLTPVREFDDVSEAHALSNLESLCAVCHSGKDHARLQRERMRNKQDCE